MENPEGMGGAGQSGAKQTREQTTHQSRYKTLVVLVHVVTSKHGHNIFGSLPIERWAVCALPA